MDSGRSVDADEGEALAGAPEAASDADRMMRAARIATRRRCAASDRRLAKRDTGARKDENGVYSEPIRPILLFLQEGWLWTEAEP